MLAALSRMSARAAPDSQGTDFWLAFPENLGTPTLSLFIASSTSTSGTVDIPGPGVPKRFSFTPGAVTSVPITSAAAVTTNDSVEAKGIHVTALDEVTVYGLNRRSATTDAYLGMPTDVLGTDYVVMAKNNSDRGTWGRTQFTVVGTEDTTSVTITPAQAAAGHAAGVPYAIALDAGDT